jgi:molecular chaperone DnaK (HSP70)
MMATMLKGVREAASQSVGEPISDASIAVPTLFTSAQREAVRDAAESVGFRISHLESSSLLAARAMKATGELSEPGQSIIVDVGASKTEVSLIYNSEFGVREVKTVGSDSIGTRAIQREIEKICMPVIQKKIKVTNPAVLAKLRKSAEAAVEHENDRRVVIPDLGNGESFEKILTEAEFRNACEPVANRIRELMREVVSGRDESSVKCVRCIGGGTKIPQIGAAIHSSFPSAEVRQLDPDDLIVCGATLDCAQRTDRIDADLRICVTAVAPYSIGISGLGDVISRMIQRGETLPAIGETEVSTTVDFQMSLPFNICQGEHYLKERSDQIGMTVFHGLTPRPRGQCQAACRIEYDENGILQFSAVEIQSGRWISATFTAKTEFTDEDRNRLQIFSEADLLEEMKLASLRYARAEFLLDVERAEGQPGSYEFKAATQKWRAWIDSHTQGEVRMFEVTRHEMQTEFQRLNTIYWYTIDDLEPDLQFTRIWPKGPSFTEEGAAIIRFSTAADFPNVIVCVRNRATKEETLAEDQCQFSVGGKIETVVRVCFPANGKYAVMAFAGRVGETRRSLGKELRYTKSEWLFDVSRVPAAKRHLCQLITGRQFMTLKCPDTFRIEPAESCVRIPGTVYRFKCSFRGDRLVINGREPEGENGQIFFPRVNELPSSGGWKSEECTLECPATGVWRAIFWIDRTEICVQTIIAGSSGNLSLTAMEKAALSAPPR